MDIIVFIIIFAIMLYYLYSFHKENVFLKNGINSFIKHENKYKEEVSYLNKELDKVINQYNKMVDSHNNIETQLQQKKDNTSSILNLKNFYIQMFKDVLEKNPQCLNTFFSITKDKDYSSFQHPDLSSNFFIPNEILKESLKNKE